MPKNAALYLSDPSMIGSRLFDRFETIQSYEGINDDNDSASAFILTLPWGDIRMNIMEGDKLRDHMNGFEGYAQHVIDDRDRLIYTLARMTHVRMNLGCMINHSDDQESEVLDFLFSFNASLNGLLFLYDSIFDWSGEALGGPAADEPNP